MHSDRQSENECEHSGSIFNTIWDSVGWLNPFKGLSSGGFYRKATLMAATLLSSIGTAGATCFSVTNEGNYDLYCPFLLERDLIKKLKDSCYIIFAGDDSACPSSIFHNTMSFGRATFGGPLCELNYSWVFTIPNQCVVDLLKANVPKKGYGTDFDIFATAGIVACALGATAGASYGAYRFFRRRREHTIDAMREQNELQPMIHP